MKSNPKLACGTTTKGSVEASSGLPSESVPAVLGEYPGADLQGVPEPPSQAMDMPAVHHTAPSSVQTGIDAGWPVPGSKSVLFGYFWQLVVSARSCAAVTGAAPPVPVVVVVV